MQTELHFSFLNTIKKKIKTDYPTKRDHYSYKLVFGC